VLCIDVQYPKCHRAQLPGPGAIAQGSGHGTRDARHGDEP
jgi:hypothetical protein